MTRWLDVLGLRVRSLVRRGAVDRDLERELRFHLDKRIEELIVEGRTAEDARHEALREFGSTASITQQCRETRRVSFVENLVQDLRYAVRILRAQPMLLVAATTSIALGVGANLAIFGLANDLLLSTPTARLAEDLVHIRTAEGSHTSTVAWREYEISGVLAGVAGYRLESDVIWRGREASSAIVALIVTANFFDVVGVPVVRGRGFQAREAAAELEPRLAVLSDGFLKRRLGGDPAVIGQPITLNGVPYTVIGVLPQDLRSLPGYGIVPDVFLPQTRDLVPDLDRPRAGNLQLIGRLKPHQTIEEAHAALATVAARLGETYDDRDLGTIRSVAPVGGMEQLRELKEIAAFFGVLLIVTGLVLAIACANVAGLLLARATARRREIALRLAIGASRERLVQQLLTEGFLLSALGTAGGFAIMGLLSQLVARLALPVPVPIEFHLAFDTRVVLLAGSLVIISTVLCGLTPAVQATRPTLAPALKQEYVSYGHGRFSVRGLLVAGQVSVAVLLLVITALFLRNLAMARGLSPGFDVEHGLVAQVTFVEGHQGTSDAPAVLALVERIRSIPGVETATFAGGVPLTMRYGGHTGTDLRIEGRDQPVRVDYSNNTVGPNYFETLGLEILRGRDFTIADRRGAPTAIIINQEFVRRYFNGADPIGQHIFLPSRQGEIPARIIGVVSDSKYRTIGEDRDAAVYDAILQRSTPHRFVHVLVRARTSPAALAGVVGDALLAADGSTAVAIEPLASALSFALLPSRIGAVLVGALGALGALLAMIGLYGVVAFSVSRRVSEIGIRMALGASRGSVVGLVLSDGAVLVGAGLIAGLAIALVATAPLRAFLVADLATTDSVSYAATVALLALTSLVACWSPARRATRVHPATALRME